MKKSIECWIYDTEKKRFLLLQCPENSKHKAYWQPVTGGIEPGEGDIEACVREIREETGCKLDVGRVLKLVDDFRVYASDKELSKTVFVVKSRNMTIKVSDEHVGYQWAEPDDVPSLLLWGSNKATFSRVLDYLDLMPGEE